MEPPANEPTLPLKSLFLPVLIIPFAAINPRPLPPPANGGRRRETREDYLKIPLFGSLRAPDNGPPRTFSSPLGRGGWLLHARTRRGGARTARALNFVFLRCSERSTCVRSQWFCKLVWRGARGRLEDVFCLVLGEELAFVHGQVNGVWFVVVGKQSLFRRRSVSVALFDTVDAFN